MDDDEVIKKLEFYLEKKNDFIFNNGDVISKKIYLFLKKYPRNYWLPFFSKSNVIDSYKFGFEMDCAICGGVFIKWVTKGRIGDLFSIKQKHKIKCEICTNKENVKNKISKEDYQKNMQYLKDYNTDLLINTYYNPERSWNKDIKQSERFHIILRLLSYSHIDKIKIHADTLSYSDFLSTPYWIAIRGKILYRDKYSCKMCNSKELLHVHHNNYANKGIECLNLTDLISLCSTCHENHHSINN